jgi:hypothetical protein
MQLSDVKVVKAITEQTAVIIWMHGLGDTAEGWLSELENM